jgi:3-mercaptopyruvate sulfurtransferase SseA
LGIRNVRPLLGGYHAWKELGYPLEEVPPPAEAAGAGSTLATGDLA